MITKTELKAFAKFAPSNFLNNGKTPVVKTVIRNEKKIYYLDLGSNIKFFATYDGDEAHNNNFKLYVERWLVKNYDVLINQSEGKGIISIANNTNSILKTWSTSYDKKQYSDCLLTLLISIFKNLRKT